MPEPVTHGPFPSAPVVLWIDGVGSFALCQAEELVLGQATPDSVADLCIRGSLSRRAAAIRKVGEDYILQPITEVKLRGEAIQNPVVLHHLDRFQLGNVELLYSRPSPLSCSSRLELQPPHRWQPLLDAAILLGDACVIGPSDQAHIRCHDWQHTLLLFRHGQEWWVRPPDGLSLTIGDREQSAPFRLVPGQKITGGEISMIVE
ncbi:hypothetical protein VN12_21845 [Pirellula sp. SH-Sr6A]|uniref:hypothetical protein n=1 Tax=Pirellula sp. SH-Sr6A TaxID=1632865 RepID=UPI00078E8BF4|nr:hypothetical protein [Pirellula sp. SH-Sr6A]AMV34785.1 hypothetical protein VN12_21845 [Pirellula sp. SH-Sr6A]